MEKLNINFMACNLYIDGSAEDASLAEECLKELLEERFNKPDWYYKAKAKNALGTL